MATVLELKEQRLRLWERMKEINDTAETEARNLTAEEQTNWNKAEADISDLDKRIDRQEKLERKPAVEQRFETAVKTADPLTVRATPEYRAAWRRWVAGPDAQEPEDRAILRAGMVDMRALQTTVPNAMGLAVPDSMAAGIEKALLDFGGMREVATSRSTTDGGDLTFLSGDDTSNVGEILAEGAQVSEQDSTISATVLKAFTYSSKMIRISLQLLQDASFDVEGYVTGILAERIGRIQNTNFTTGAGANSPRGIITAATLGVTGAAGQTTNILWDDLVDLEFSVGSAYRRGARFMFADSTLKILRKLKDGEGRYLWQPGAPQAGIPNSIGQYPYTINDDMAACAASAKSVLFGQLSRYLIRDVKGWTLVRFSEKYADYLQMGLMGFTRADGNLLDAGQHPVKYFQHAAA